MGINSELIGITSEEKVINSELIGITSEEKRITSELIGITSEVIIINGESHQVLVTFSGSCKSAVLHKSIPRGMLYAY
jgi:hypothetical protein